MIVLQLAINRPWARPLSSLAVSCLLAVSAIAFVVAG